MPRRLFHMHWMSNETVAIEEGASSLVTLSKAGASLVGSRVGQHFNIDNIFLQVAVWLDKLRGQ